MDKEQAIKLAQRYKAAVAERLPLKALYLYGSYSKGNHTEDTLCRHSQNGNTDIKAGITYRNKYLIIKTILSLNIGIVANNLLNIAFIIA